MDIGRDCLVAVIGGGAAGLMAAIAASEQNCNGSAPAVILLEKLDRVGKKILVTGNGRCNLSNTHMSVEHFHGQRPAFVRSALEQFPLESTLSYFKRMGLLVRAEDDGRLFPYSLQASAVLDLLRQQAERQGVVTRTSSAVCAIQVEKRAAGEFLIQTEDGRTVRAAAVILATGGLAAPQMGASGDGYRLAAAFGHVATSMFPALVQVRTETSFVKKLKGIKVDGAARVMSGDRMLDESSGEILFTEYGLSGPPLLDLSRTISEWNQSTRKAGLDIELDLLPDLSEEALVSWLQYRQSLQPDLQLEHFLTGLLNKKLGQALLKRSLGKSLTLAAEAVALNRQQLMGLARTIKRLRIPAVGTRSWTQAQVTAGGLDTSGFDHDTLCSSLQPGLFAAGEVLDIDGDCGGYNLQWAWSSGYTAGRQAIEYARTRSSSP